MPPKKKTKKLQNKSKVKNKASNKTNIKITIDNSRKTQARKPADNKPKGHVNIPVNYFPQFTPARPVITDISPNQGFNTVNFEKVNNEYQTQFKNYFDGKLDDMEKRLLEQSEKKNTAPPRPEMGKPGASHQYTDYDGETVYQEPIQKQTVPQPPQTPQPTNIHGKMIDELKSRLKGITSATPIGKPQNANIANAKPLNSIQSTNITELNSVVPLADVEEFDDDKAIEYGREAKQKKDAKQLEELKQQALQLQKYNKDNNPYYKGGEKSLDKFSIGQLETYIKNNTHPLDFYIEKQKQYNEKQNKDINYYRNEYFNLYKQYYKTDIDKTNRDNINSLSQKQLIPKIRSLNNALKNQTKA